MITRSQLLHGLGGADPAPGAVTQIDTSSAITAVAALVLLAEWLALRLDDVLRAHGIALPGDVDGRLTALAVSAPVMLRWSYLLRAPAENVFICLAGESTAALRGASATSARRQA